MEGYHPSSPKPREDDILWSFSAPNVKAQTEDESSDEPEEMEDENSLQDRTIETERNLWFPYDRGNARFWRHWMKRKISPMKA